FVDLAPEETLAAAPALCAAGWAVVPVIQRWCPPSALLPADRLRASLIAVGQRLPRRVSAAAGPVFLLDGRPFDRPDRPPPGRFATRCDSPPCRFPPPTLLRARGVELVCWLGRAHVAPDLRDYASALGEIGLRSIVGARG